MYAVRHGQAESVGFASLIMALVTCNLEAEGNRIRLASIYCERSEMDHV